MQKLRSVDAAFLGVPNADAEVSVLHPHEHDGVSDDELLLVHERAPPHGEEVAPGRATVDVLKLSDQCRRWRCR
jgi:hypothetical protein